MEGEHRRLRSGGERGRLGCLVLLSLLVVGPALAGPVVPARSGDAGALELVFVDPTVADRESLLADLRAPSGSGRRFEIVALESTRDGVRQVTETLAGHARLEAIHFVTHGTEAAVRLGGSWLTPETVAVQADALSSWGRALKPDGDLLFYACDLASSDRGRALVDQVAGLTRADVAASTDRTGAESRGGNWRLEHRVGPVDTPIAVSAEEQRAWSHVLAVYTVTNTNDSGAGSLRAAIASANGTAVADTIEFNIPGAGVRTINSLAPELQITRPVTIDGTTQPLYAGTPLIELNGSGAGAINGLVLTGVNSSNSTIRGLAINRFTNGSRAAIRIQASSTGNAIVGNHLGTNPAGTAASANGVGVIITGTTNKRIGGTLPGERNIISGNSVDGIQIFGATTLGNLVQGNYIGLDVTGLVDLGNGAQGVSIWNQSDNNTVEGNVISGNNNGIAINDEGTTGNVVRGNLIGTDKDGGGPGVGNTMRGVTFDAGCTGNRVGGTAAGDGNTIAYNGSEGVWINPTVSGITILGNSIFSNTGMGIDQSGNGFPELNDTGDLDAGGNALQNHPALSAAMTDGAGTANFAGSLHSAANTWYRVELFASSVTDATGYGEGERYLGTTNVQTNGSGNATIGASMATVNALNALDFVTATATVCTDGAACTTYGDSSEFGGAIVAVGTLLVTTTDDTVGGNTASVPALIAAPGGDGRISLREAITAANNTPGADTVGFGIPLTDTRHYYYQNNAGPGLGPEALTTLADWSTPSSPVIAFDPDHPFGQPRSWYRIQPTSALPVIVSPLVLDGSRANPLSNEVGPLVEIDGTSGSTTTLDLQAGSSGSTIRGLVINRAPPPSGNAILVRSSNNVIAGNYLGTNAAGTAPGSGNGVGVRISGGASAANDNRVGGATAADRNVLSANNLDGVMISGGVGGAANNVVQGNYIGLDVTGTQDLGNANQGIAVFGTSNTNNVIGGTAPGAGNVISGNGGDGVGIEAAGATGTLVQANRIGTNAAGTAGVPNTGSGVRMHLSTSNNTVGGTAANAGNLIAYNNPGNTVGDGGVELRTDAGTGNSILGNSIHSNGGLGIDLNQDGVTVNDPLDGDGGPNSRLNYPDLTFARDSGGVITVAFDLDVPTGSYRIELFKNAAADPQPRRVRGGGGGHHHRHHDPLHERAVHDLRQHLRVQRRGDGAAGDGGGASLVRGAGSRGRGGAFLADGVRAPEPGLPSPPGDVGGGALRSDHAVPDPGARVVPGRPELLLARLRPVGRGAVPLPAGGRRHRVEVDAPRSGVGGGGSLGGRSTRGGRGERGFRLRRFVLVVPVVGAFGARRGGLDVARVHEALGPGHGVARGVVPGLTSGGRGAPDGRVLGGARRGRRRRVGVERSRGDGGGVRAGTRHAHGLEGAGAPGAAGRWWRRWSGRRCASPRRRDWTSWPSGTCGLRRPVSWRWGCLGTGRCGRCGDGWRGRGSRVATLRRRWRGCRGRCSRGRGRARSWSWRRCGTTGPGDS
jgi:parallel beta-helix repeat protein